MLVYFGYTHCPDVCPTTMADLGTALRQLPAQIQQATQVVFVTSDPARDTAPVLRAWLANFDAGLARTVRRADRVAGPDRPRRHDRSGYRWRLPSSTRTARSASNTAPRPSRSCATRPACCGWPAPRRASTPTTSPPSPCTADRCDHPPPADTPSATIDQAAVELTDLALAAGRGDPAGADRVRHPHQRRGVAGVRGAGRPGRRRRPGPGHLPARGPIAAHLSGGVPATAVAADDRAAGLRRGDQPPPTGSTDHDTSGHRTTGTRHATCPGGSSCWTRWPALPPHRREALVLTCVVGLSYAEAAAVCGCPVGTIRSRVGRARAELAAFVRERADGPRPCPCPRRGPRAMPAPANGPAPGMIAADPGWDSDRSHPRGRGPDRVRRARGDASGMRCWSGRCRTPWWCRPDRFPGWARSSPTAPATPCTCSRPMPAAASVAPAPAPVPGRRWPPAAATPPRAPASTARCWPRCPTRTAARGSSPTPATRSTATPGTPPPAPRTGKALFLDGGPWYAVTPAGNPVTVTVDLDAR